MLAGVKKQILVYGLKSARDKFILSYSEEKLTSNNYIDFYNNEIKKAIDCATKNLSTAEKWKDFTNNLLNYLSSSVSNFPFWKNYLQCLQKNEKNRLENIYKDVHILKLGENYFFEKNGEVIKPILHAKRGCKIGIDVAKLDPNVELFFVLDEINMRDVVHKNDFRGRSITNRELRYVYRHRFSLENKVTFFLKGEKCEAPWKTDPQLWEQYKHSRQSFIYKYKDIREKKQEILAEAQRSNLNNMFIDLKAKAISESSNRNEQLPTSQYSNADREKSFI